MTNMVQSKKGIPQPQSTLKSQAMDRFCANARSANPREFRDAITKVTGGIRGIPTDAIQWNRLDK
jgi:hypothetical protein